MLLCWQEWGGNVEDELESVWWEWSAGLQYEFITLWDWNESRPPETVLGIKLDTLGP